MTNQPLKGFTVFCRQTNNVGTTWIGHVYAESLDEAVQLGRGQCADEWGSDEEDVHVLGVAEGEITILQWDDIQ